MSHVDEGRLHAYLDGALPGGIEARREVEDHLRVCVDCRALLEAASVDRGGTREILGLLRPMEVETPPFQELVARQHAAADPGAVGGGSGGPSAGPVETAAQGAAGVSDYTTRRGSRFSLAWAATVVLALGAGWMARGVWTAPSRTGQAAVEVAARAEPQGQPRQIVEQQASSTAARANEAQDAEVNAMAPAETRAEAPTEAGTTDIDAVGEPTQAAFPPLDPEPPPPEAAVPDPTATAERLANRAPPAVQAATQPRARVAADAALAGATVAGPVETAAAGLIEAEALRDDAAELVSVSADPDALTGRRIEARLSMRESSATEMGAWVMATPAEAARRLGSVPLQLDGFPWERMEIAEIEGEILVRTVHPVAGFGRVELIQGLSPLAEPERNAQMEVLREAFERDALPTSTIVAEQGGIALMLRGLENREALESLLERLR